MYFFSPSWKSLFMTLFILLMYNKCHSQTTDDCKTQTDENDTYTCDDIENEKDSFKNRYKSTENATPQYDDNMNQIDKPQSKIIQKDEPQTAETHRKESVIVASKFENPTMSPPINKGRHTEILQQTEDGAHYGGSGIVAGHTNPMKGHLKPFGESGQKVPIRTILGFPSIINNTNHHEPFFLDYVLTSRPLLMKGAAKLSPFSQKWTDDDYLLRVSSLEENRHERVDVEEGKKERREGDGVTMRFDEFLSGYNKSDWYLVQDLLPWMESLSLLPCPLQCPQMNDVPMKSVLWFSSGGTNSVVHTDGEENINCLYRGHKTLVMVDPAIISTGTIIDKLEGSYSSLDVDKVDLNLFPTLRGVEFITASMEPGDCLYIPRKWIHQVRSFGSNAAINVWFHARQTRELLQKGHCTGNDVICDPTFTLGRVRHPELIDDDNTLEDGLYLLRRFFQYSTIHGKGAIYSPDNLPMKKRDERVRLEGFVQDFIEHHLEDLYRFKVGNDDGNDGKSDDNVDNNNESNNNDYDDIDDDNNECNNNSKKRKRTVNAENKSETDKSDENHHEDNVNDIDEGNVIQNNNHKGIENIENLTDETHYINFDTNNDDNDDENVGEMDKESIEHFKRVVWGIGDVLRQLDRDNDGVVTSFEMEEGIVDTWNAMVRVVSGNRS